MSTDGKEEYRFGLKSADLEDKDEMIRRSFQLKNASKAEVRKNDVALAIKQFERFEGDTGSSEVQIGVLTIKINALSEHMRTHKKDFHSRHGLDKLVSKRRRLLQYLRGKNFETYKRVLHAFGLRDIINQLQQNKTQQGKRKIYFRGGR